MVTFQKSLFEYKNDLFCLLLNPNPIVVAKISQLMIKNVVISYCVAQSQSF